MRDPFPPPPSLPLARAIQPLAQRLSLSTLPLHIHEVLFGWAGYHVLFTYASPLLSSYLVPRVYGQLNARTKVNWNVRVVSFVQSCFINTAALCVIFGDAQRAGMDWRGRIWGYSGAGGMVQGFAAGYFLWDLTVSTQYLSVLGPGSLAHAISALLVTCLGFRPFANYYGLNFVLYELSTPFLNIHWFLDKLNMTGSRLQLYNGIALLVSFFCCRVLWGNYQSLRIYSDVLTALQSSNVEVPLANNITVFDYQHPDMKVNLVADKVMMKLPMWLVFLYLGSNTLLNFLNIYWFGKMVQTVMSRFRPKDEKLEDKKLEEKKK